MTKYAGNCSQTLVTFTAEILNGKLHFVQWNLLFICFLAFLEHFFCSIILPLAWADLGPLQYRRWRSSWLKSRVESYYYCSKEFHLMYGRGPSSASEKHRQIKTETVSPFSSVWVPLILFCFIILRQLFTFSMLLSWLYFHKKSLVSIWRVPLTGEKLLASKALR